MSEPMHAVGCLQPLPSSDAGCLIDFLCECPTPALRDVLVRVHAVSVNPVDTKVRTRKKPAMNTPTILGWDAAGVVIAVGEQCSLFRAGDEVFYAGAIDRPGSNAQFQVVDERLVARKPLSASFAQAAALPLTTITAWELLFDRLMVERSARSAGMSLLIIAGAGGVGSMLIQLARQLTELTVIATASRPSSAAWCRDLGAHHVIDHSRPLNEELHKIGFKTVDLIAGLSGTQNHLPAIIDSIAPQGKFALIDDPPTLDIKAFKQKCASVHWEYMFARSLFSTPDMIAQHQLLGETATLVDAGLIRTTLTKNCGTITAENVRQAHILIEEGRTIGKLVLEGF